MYGAAPIFLRKFKMPIWFFDIISESHNGILIIENRAEIHKFLFFVFVFFSRTFPHRTRPKPHLFNENGHKMESVSNSVLGIKKDSGFLRHCLVVHRCFTFFAFGWVIGSMKKLKCATTFIIV